MKYVKELKDSLIIILMSSMEFWQIKVYLQHLWATKVQV